MSTNPNALTIVNPIVITDAIIDVSGSPPATNVPENDYAVWAIGTTYAQGDRVILTSTHRIYESLLGSNTGNSPTDVSSPTYWIDAGPTNRWAVFDLSVNKSTVQADNITYVLEPNTAINTLAILNALSATILNITMFSPATGSPGIVYERTVDLTDLPRTPDWWAWFYGTKVERTQSILLDLPSYSDCVVKIELIGGTDLSLGEIIIGQQQNFGIGVNYGARVGIQDYSRKETNDFGDTVLIQRAFAKRANFNLLINKNETDTLQNVLSRIRAVPVLWIASSDHESTTVFGFYKNFDILISYPLHSECELEIEGLV